MSASPPASFTPHKDQHVVHQEKSGALEGSGGGSFSRLYLKEPSDDPSQEPLGLGMQKKQQLDTLKPTEKSLEKP